MNSLTLVCLEVEEPSLMRFAAKQGLIGADDEGFGYALHAWLKALFGKHAPKPFRYFEKRRELLGYSAADAGTLWEHAADFADPVAYEALVESSLATKPMPASWRPGKRLRADVVACPVSRKDGTEKDVYLRALDRLGDNTPSRTEVYIDWFSRQWQGAAEIEKAELTGFSRMRLLRRARNGGGKSLRNIERPRVLFNAVIHVANPERFSQVLARGVGRHRAFGFGMVLLAPPP